MAHPPERLAPWRGLQLRLLAGFAALLLVLWRQGEHSLDNLATLTGRLAATATQEAEHRQLELDATLLRVAAFRVLGTQHVEQQAKFRADYDAARDRLRHGSRRLATATAAVTACIDCYDQAIEKHTDFQTKKAYEQMNGSGQELHDAALAELSAARQRTAAAAASSGAAAVDDHRAALVHSPPPQPLKIQSTAARLPAASCTKVGPVSRIQKSSITRSTISMPDPNMRVARAISDGSTIIVTGSNSAMAWATAVQAA